MSPNIPRPTSSLPDPRGVDGAPTWDVSLWTAPQLLYDLARGFVAPGVAADGHPISDEEALDLALATMGGGSLRGVAVQKGLGRLEKLRLPRAKLYNGPITECPFSADYPDVQGRYTTAGNLTHDIDGNPLEVGGRIVGRSVVGGADEALSPTLNLTPLQRKERAEGLRLLRRARSGDPELLVRS